MLGVASDLLHFELTHSSEDSLFENIDCYWKLELEHRTPGNLEMKATG